MDSKHWDLIAKYISAKTSEEENSELFKWVKENPENEEIFKQAQNLWKHLPDNLDDYTPDTEKSWQELRIRLLNEKSKDNIRSLKPARILYMVAASIALLLTIGYLLTKKAESTIATFDKLTEVSTNNNIEVFYLPDSSLIWLNKNSRISYPERPDKTERIVYLEGEAFFKVKRDSTKPFRIFADNCVTTVLGTSFNIKAYPKDANVEVSVVTGKVNLSIIKDTVRDHILTLLPHDKGIFNKKNFTVTQHKNEDLNCADWKGNLIELKKTMLYQKEATNIPSYLLNNSEWRQNLLKQTLIDGEINNHARLVTYKNIKFKVMYYSHGGKKLATKYFIINSVIGPGKTILYSYKLNHWFSNTTKVIVEIEHAEIFENESLNHQ
jgi:transmembrane sensor